MVKALIALALFFATDSFAQSNFWIPLGSLATTEPYISIHVGPADDIYIGTQGPGIFRSSDGGTSWDKDWEMPGWWANATEIFAPSADTVVAAAGQGFLRSVDSGKHWVAMNAGLTSTGLVDLALSPSGAIYVLSSKGVISKTTDVGNSWSRIDSLPVLRALEIEVTSQGEIVVGSYNAGLFISSNEGATWSHKFDTATFGRLKSRSDGTLFLTKESDLFSTIDLGNTMIDLGLSGPTDLEIDSRGILFASTIESPGIRFLDTDNTWKAYHSEGLHTIYDMALSTTDEMYAITFGQSAFRARAATTSRVINANATSDPGIRVIGTSIQSDRTCTIELLDILGVRAQTLHIEAGEVVDIKDRMRAPGVYFAKCVDQAGVISIQKIMLP